MDRTMFEHIVDIILFAVCLFMLAGNIYVSVRMRFIQLTFLPTLFRIIKSWFIKGSGGESEHTILPYKALFTAMSTTLGIGTMIGPIIAIHVGGPGALLGFLLATFFGSAATFTEVHLCLKYRQKEASGEIMGGPMQYLKVFISPFAAKWYAFFCCIVMIAWSAANANQVAAIFDSPLLGDYRVPAAAAGACFSLLIVGTLLGGIKRISAFSVKLVPLLFVIYLGASLWILGTNVDKLGDVFGLIVKSAWSPYGMATGTLVGGVVSALRWGTFKAMQGTEAGVGTQAIPHSMAETDDSVTQGMIAMVSTYTSGFVACISGLVALVTETWQDPSLPVGMSMVAAAFHMYFSNFGIVIVVISAVLFGFGCTVGNSYNGSRCFIYLADRKRVHYYYIAVGLLIFLGSILSAKLVWSMIDLALACIVVPHMAALIIYATKQQQKQEGEFTV
jgi:AGCS family alanine or glycine:cation symporter